MRFSTVLANADARVRRPGTWVAVLLFGVVWDLLRWGAMPSAWLPAGLIFPFLLGAVLLVLAPLPWQWTGDDRLEAPFLQGLAQALLLNAVVVIVVLQLLPPENHMPMMMGRGMRMRGPGRGPFMLPPWQVRLWILGVASVAFGLLLGRMVAQRDAERTRTAEAERKAEEAQTRALQAQMNPHVLFNTISGLAELAREDGPATETALVKLADLLRRLLDHAGRNLAPLAQERDLVEGLLALEQFRLGERLTVRWSWDASLEGLAVPPLLLQPLVENAIKHGIAPSRTGGELEIGLSGTPEALRLWVANTGQPLREDRPEGVGLSNLRQRLALMRDHAASFHITASEGRTLAEVRLTPSQTTAPRR